MKPYFSNRYQAGLPPAGGWSSVRIKSGNVALNSTPRFTELISPVIEFVFVLLFFKNCIFKFV